MSLIVLKPQTRFKLLKESPTSPESLMEQLLCRLLLPQLTALTSCKKVWRVQAASGVCHQNANICQKLLKTKTLLSTDSSDLALFPSLRCQKMSPSTARKMNSTANTTTKLKYFSMTRLSLSPGSILNRLLQHHSITKARAQAALNRIRCLSLSSAKVQAAKRTKKTVKKFNFLVTLALKSQRSWQQLSTHRCPINSRKKTLSTPYWKTTSTSFNLRQFRIL